MVAGLLGEMLTRESGPDLTDAVEDAGPVQAQVAWPHTEVERQGHERHVPELRKFMPPDRGTAAALMVSG